MSLIGLIVVIVVVGVLLWAAEQIPMSPPIRRVLQVVVVVFLVLWLLQSFGLLSGNLRLD